MNRCMRYLVAGRVQGVFYRASTRDTARRLGLCGRARNLSDGRVEVIACGDSARLTELERWLWQGPPYAKVEQVITEVLEPPPVFTDFETG